MTRSILITGCSSGIGLAAAQTLADRGWQVLATARKQQDVDRLTALGLTAAQLDVCDDESIKTAINTLLAQTDGRLDALFNNAGFAIPGKIEDLTRDNMQQQFDTNVFGAMRVVQAVLPIMKQQQSGRIVQNSSILGFVSLPYYGAYNASKHALESFTDTLRLELRGSGIHTTLIEPGPITSEFRHNAEKSFQTNLNPDPNNKALYQRLQQANSQPSRLTLPPEKVIDCLIHAIESPTPKLRYPVGLPGKGLRLAKRLLPERALDKLLHTIMKDI